MRCQSNASQLSVWCLAHTPGPLYIPIWPLFNPKLLHLPRKTTLRSYLAENPHVMKSEPPEEPLGFSFGIRGKSGYIFKELGGFSASSLHNPYAGTFVIISLYTYIPVLGSLRAWGIICLQKIRKHIYAVRSGFKVEGLG